MIFKKDEIVKFMSTEVVKDDEFTSINNLHRPTGVFFSCTYKNNDENDFLYFTIGVVTEKADIAKKKVFESKTSDEFFEAVRYFESLITERIPEEKPQPPSAGIFVYAKNPKFTSFVNALGLKIEIPKDDVLKAFTPPKKKPYGRLDMTIFDNPEYDPIKMKFALNFDEELTKKMTEMMSGELGDIYAYQITPYSNNTQESDNQSEPENVNDEQLTPDQIEGEDAEQMKGSKTEQPKPKEPKTDEGDEGEKDEQKVDEGDEGEDSDQNSKGDENDKVDETDEGDGTEGEDEGDNQNDEDLSERDGGDGVNTENPDENEEPDLSMGHGDGNEPSKMKLPESLPESLTSLQTSDVVEGLNQLFKTTDLSSWKKQQRLLNALSSFNDAQLKESIYQKLNIPQDIDKKQFIELVKQRTATYFE